MIIQDVVNFVHEQRDRRGSHKVLHNWSDMQIAQAISRACDTDAFGWVMTGNKLTGISWGIPRPHERVFDVQSVVCATRRDLAQLMLLVSQRYPGWTLRGLRKKKVDSHKIVDYRKIDRFVHLTQLTAANTK